MIIRTVTNNRGDEIISGNIFNTTLPAIAEEKKRNAVKYDRIEDHGRFGLVIRHLNGNIETYIHY